MWKGWYLISKEWFKHSSCKEDDFRELPGKTIIEDESLLLRHVNKKWLALCLVLGRIVERWDDAKEYFLNYLPEEKEFKKSLQKNCHYQPIVKELKEEITTLAEIKFLIGIGSLFNTYLHILQ